MIFSWFDEAFSVGLKFRCDGFFFLCNRSSRKRCIKPNRESRPGWPPDSYPIFVPTIEDILVDLRPGSLPQDL
jgi:hypothetical protein